MWSRRRFVAMVPLASAGLVLARRVNAASAVVGVPNHAIGALVRAVGADLVELEVDGTLSPTEIRVAGALASITDRILLKGSGVARGRFLDDGRNASRVGGNIRELLSKAIPEHKDALVANHRAWARPLARDVLAWTRTLEKSKVFGHRVRDEHARPYLLEWAGAVVDPAGEASPAGLAALPAHPTQSTPAAYHDYLAALVRAL